VEGVVSKYQYRGSEQAPIMTSIVILRANRVYDMVERISYRAIYENMATLEILIVNDGSSQEDSRRIEELCEINGFSYLELDTRHEDFNASRARNMGAIYAKGQFIMHEDIDLIGYAKFYKDIITQIEIQGLYSDNTQIMTVPVAYLSQDASDNFFELNDSFRKPYFIDSYLKGETHNFEFFMPASSLIVISRYYYLMIGGYNERFKNWGLEDLEFIYRCLKSTKKFALPERDKALFTTPAFAKQLTYKGWRTMFRLHGDLMFQQGIIMFHIFHDKDKKWRNKQSHENNVELFNECTRRFDVEGHYLPPLPSNPNEKSLIFGKGCFAYNRALIPFFGEMVVKGYENFDGSKIKNIDVLDFIQKEKITRVIFTNPYANLQRQNIYKMIREAGVPYYVVERGALRDSMFVDLDGFSCESRSYNEALWDKQITRKNESLAIEYIEKEKATDDSLETQPKRVGIRELNYKLGIGSSKKVLFVPLQSRSDTTINYFAGDIETYDNFLDLVREVTQRLYPDWLVVVKKHPLSKIKEDIPDAVFVDNYNIKDLLDRCDAILLINSGVGVLGALWGKLVLHCGQAFYRSDKLNRKVINAAQVIQALESEFEPRSEDILRFTSYLINEFYCFGKMTTSTKDYTDKALLTITEAIEYYKVNIDGKRLFDSESSHQIPTSAPIYDIFRNSIQEPTSASANRKLLSDKNKAGVELARVTQGNTNISFKAEQRLNKNKKSNSLKRKVKKFYKQPKRSIVDIVNKRLGA
jgi:predicted glycosyltransferase involved in capsule biosynthesis